MAKPNPSRRPDREHETREANELTFRAALEPTSINEEKRTVDLVWSVGSDVRRYDWYRDRDYIESLSMDSKHVRLGRLNDGGPVLDTHGRWSVRDILGAVVPGSARIVDGKGVATVRFSERDDVTPIWNDVKAGIVRSVSVGYVVHKWEKTPAEGKEVERRKAVDWEPHEVSMVPVPADAGAGTRSADNDLAQSRAQENDHMETPEEKAAREAAEAKRAKDQELEQRRAQEADASKREQEAAAARASDVAAAQERAVAITNLCERHKISAEQRTAWLRGNESVGAIGLAILDGMAARTLETHVSPVTPGDGSREKNAARDAADAILRRAGEKVDGDGYRNFGDGSLIRMAEQFLNMGGVSTRTMTRLEIAQRALTTQDFSSVLYLAGEKQMRKGYDGYPLVHREVFRKTTSSDFREKHQFLISAGGILPEVPEGGVITRQGASSEQSKYALKSYGVIIAITRKMIIDDDIGAVTKIAQQRGRSAAETERKLVWDFVMSNTLAGPTSQDGTAMFTTGHANFPAASGTPISDTKLTEVQEAFANRLGPDGFAMNAQLKHIVTSVKGVTPWDVLLNGVYVPTSTSGVVTERMRAGIKIHVEPLISTTKKHWYGFADYNQVDSFEYAYLAGFEGPRLEQRNGFEVEGIELKVCLDFGIGAIDYRGAFLQRET